MNIYINSRKNKTVQMVCYEQTEFHYAILNITLHFSPFLNKTISIRSEKLFLQQKTDTFTETVFVKFMEMLKGMKVDANHIYLQTYLISSSMLKIVKVSYFIFCVCRELQLRGGLLCFRIQIRTFHELLSITGHTTQICSRSTYSNLFIL